MDGGGLTNSKYVELGGEATNRTIMCQTYHPSFQELHTANLTKKFKEKYGRNPNPNTAQSHDAIMIVGVALEKAGVDDKSKIRGTITSTLNFNGVTGIISFDDTGDSPREMKVI